MRGRRRKGEGGEREGRGRGERGREGRRGGGEERGMGEEERKGNGIHNIAPSVCAGDSQLTESRQLLSLSSITASSETSDDPVEDLVDRSFFFPSAWCSTQAFSEAPYVQLNFSSDVTLSYMEARGAITGFSYVTEFQLEIFDERSGNFTQYGVTDEPTVSGSVC